MVNVELWIDTRGDYEVLGMFLFCNLIIVKMSVHVSHYAHYDFNTLILAVWKLWC